MKKGFTLVESSIVLVIIGLLIGGILVGQSLIESAKLQNEVRKTSQWSIAVINFKEKFNQYPGDSIYFTPAGNDNGDMASTTGSCPTTYINERLLAWSHLSQAQMLNENYVWDNATACTFNIGNFKGMTPTKDSKSYIDQYIYIEITANKSGQSFGGNNYEYNITNQYKLYDLLAIETKLDDGVPSTSTGKLHSGTYPDEYNCDPNGAESQIPGITGVTGVTEKEDVMCFTYFYFNNPITPN